jgi:type VI secretion system protein ImpG
VEYLAQPSKTGVADRRHLEIYSVDKVMALSAATGLDAYEVEPFYAFSHSRAPEAAGSGYYQTHLVPNVRGGDPRQGTDLYVSFVLGGKDGLPEDQTISMELTCTNRHLPSELRAGDINAPTDSSPPGVRFRNLVKPTPTVCPPLGKALHWRLISHMALNYVSLSDVKHFKELLRVYDFLSEQDVQHSHTHQRMLDGIISVGSTFAQRMVRGAPLRGSQVRGPGRTE